VIVAKGITSGYAPLGGVLVGPRVWEPFYAPDGPWFRHGLTYSGHATACAVAQANLDVIEEEDLVGRVARMSPVLFEKLSALQSHELVVEVRGGTGLIVGVQMSPDVNGDAFQRACIDAGVLIRILGGNVVQISPPFVIEESEIDQIVDAIRAGLDAAAAA
jgi:adenosylmethionine-8-amino-7-oxononanoate aminotransferase